LGGGLFCSTTTASTTGGNSSGQGGGGGGGRIKVFYNDCAPGNIVSPTNQLSGGTGNGGAAASGSYHAGADVPFSPGGLSPATQTLCYLGDPGNLNSLPATGGYGQVSYQWQSSVGCTGNFSNIPGANSLNYDPPSGITSTTCFRLQVLSGTCVAYADTLIVNVIPPQSASINPAGNISSCLGDSVLLETSGGSGASYQWLLNGMAIPAANDSFLVVNSSGAYSVQIFYPVGCAGLSTQTNITFSPPPSAFVFAGGDTVLCPGEQITLNAFGSGNYQWQFNGSDVPGATSNTFLASQPGFYQVAVTSGGGCTSVSDSLILVGSVLPTASISNSGPLAFCAGDSVLLSSTGGTVVSWLQNGLPIVGQADSIFPAYGSGQFSVVVEGPLGCRDTSLQVLVFSDTVEAGLTAAVSPIACLGDSALYLASGGGSYQWLFNQLPIADTTNFLFAGTQGDYTVVVTSSVGCVDTSSTLAFSYFPPVIPSIQLVGSPFICPGDTVLLIGDAPGSTGVQWLLNDIPLVGETAVNHLATTAGVYTLQAQDIFGCEYVSSFTPVFPGAEPLAEILLAGPALICRGDSLVLLGQGGDSLFWYRDGVLIQADTSTLLTIDSGGSYTLVVRTSCGSDSSAALEIEGDFGPTADFFANNLPDNLVEFVDQSISGASWWWYFENGDSSLLQNPVHVFPGPGPYEVTMVTMDIFGCTDTISRTIVVEDPILFIPNVFSPNGDGVNDWAQTNFNQLETFYFSIYDRWGKVVFETRSKSEYWDGRVGNGLAPEGVYFFQLEGTDARGKDVQTKGNLTLLR
jgi:gliding motility-associated-like protein